MQKNGFRPLNHMAKINSKWIKDLSVRPKYTKFLEGNIGEKFHDIGLGKDFWGMIPKA